MKAFKKWWKKKYKSDFDEYKPIGEAGWKAALHWMLDNLGHSIEHKEIADIINKELEE